MALAHCLIVALLLIGAPQTRAERPVPAFQVATVDGVVLSSEQLSNEAQFLLVYLDAESETSRRLLQAMGEWATPDLVRRTVLIVGGSLQQAHALLAQSLPDDLQEVSRYVDANSTARQALGLRGAPVLIGVREGHTEWTLTGVLADPAPLKSVMLSWVSP